MTSKKTNLKELEIKLYAASSVLMAIRESALLIEHSNKTWQSKELLNQYVDTPNQALTTASVALRVRKDGNQYIQTLKAKGHSIGGFSERDEFDWVIDGPELELKVLDAEHWPTSLSELDKTTLSTIFTTDFIRDYMLVSWQDGNQQAQMEVALDRGWIKTANQREELTELELELREGSVDVMLDFAIKLAHLFPLIPSDTSKAERGYRLLNKASYSLQRIEKPVTYDAIKLVKYHLSMTQKLVGYYLWCADDRAIVAWVEELQQLFGVLDKVNKNLQVLLTPLLKDWQENLQQRDKKLLIDKINQEINKTRWGGCFHYLLHAGC